jgi:hypothetical protein
MRCGFTIWPRLGSRFAFVSICLETDLIATPGVPVISYIHLLFAGL